MLLKILLTKVNHKNAAKFDFRPEQIFVTNGHKKSLVKMLHYLKLQRFHKNSQVQDYEEKTFKDEISRMNEFFIS